MMPDVNPVLSQEELAQRIHDEHCGGYQCTGYRCEVKDAAAAGLRHAEALQAERDAARRATQQRVLEADATEDRAEAAQKRAERLAEALRKIYDCMGGDAHDGWNSPEDVWGIARAALEDSPNGA